MYLVNNEITKQRNCAFLDAYLANCQYNPPTITKTMKFLKIEVNYSSNVIIIVITIITKTISNSNSNDDNGVDNDNNNK